MSDGKYHRPADEGHVKTRLETGTAGDRCLPLAMVAGLRESGGREARAVTPLSPALPGASFTGGAQLSSPHTRFPP